MSMEQTLGKAFIEELNKRDFYVVKDDGQRIEIEHSKTQVKIIVKCSQDDIYTVNFENKKGEKFLKSDWYLGNEFGLCRDDIITIISKPEFIAFSDVSLSEKKAEQHNRITLLKKMFADETERFYEILQHFNFQLVNEVDKAIYIQNDDLAMTIKIYYAIEDGKVWAEELSTGLTRCIGSLDEKKVDFLIDLLEDRIIQRSQEIAKERLSKQDTLLTKFRKFEHIDRLIKSHTSFIITEDEPNIFIIHDGNYNMNIQVQVEENNVCVYIYDEKGEELGSETLGNVSSLDNTIFNFAIFYERIYQDIRKERFDKAMEQDKNFDNVRIHKGTEDITDTQNKIKNVCDNISELLIYKNQKYGNSALQPNNIFYKGNAETSILIRLDDKIGRIKNNPDNELRYNDVIDIIGYLVLYLVLKGIRPEDIQKLRD